MPNAQRFLKRTKSQKGRPIAHDIVAMLEACLSRNPERVQRSRSLRQDDVPAEKLLWKALRNHALGGFKFRRQHPIGPYFVDLACVECALVIEVDGESHLDRRREDDERTRSIQSAAWLVLRFWNTDVYDDLEAVKEAIYQECLRRGKKDQCPFTIE